MIVLQIIGLLWGTVGAFVFFSEGMEWLAEVVDDWMGE